MESMQASFEAEARAKVEALKSKKKLEQDIVELESALDNANRGRADADKVIKKLQQQVKDIEAVRHNNFVLTPFSVIPYHYSVSLQIRHTAIRTYVHFVLSKHSVFPNNHFRIN